LTDIPMGGTTSGSIADNGGWTITVSDLSPEGMRVSISGAGTRAAQIDMCDAGGAEAVLLDADGETADITCVTTTTGTNASSQVTAAVASPSIEVREPPTGSGTVVMLPQGQTVTIGSPVVASSSNTQPIGVGLVDANNLETAFFALDSDESVDVQPDPSGTSNVTVLSGSITMELAGQTATVTLDTDDSVNVQSDPSSGTSNVAVVSGSVIVEVGGQTTTVGVGQTFSLMPVTIDIKPGTFPNTINLGSRGTVPVAILSSATLDARSVNPSTVTVAGAPVQLRGRGIPMASFQDVNGDGLLDLVVHIDTPALQLNSSATEAVLVGSMFDGKTIRGADSVRIVP
jgi:quercetin dioxygenase-like cupin family protein